MKGDAARRAMLRRLGKASKAGTLTVTVDVWSAYDAFQDAEWAEYAANYYLTAYESVRDREPMQCFGCCKPWTDYRCPVRLVGVKFYTKRGKLQRDGMIMGLCEQCDLAKIQGAMERDFGIDVQVMMSSSSTVQ